MLKKEIMYSFTLVPSYNFKINTRRFIIYLNTIYLTEYEYNII